MIFVSFFLSLLKIILKSKWKICPIRDFILIFAMYKSLFIMLFAAYRSSRDELDESTALLKSRVCEIVCKGSEIFNNSVK